MSFQMDFALNLCFRDLAATAFQSNTEKIHWECCWLVIGRVLQLLTSLIVLLKLAHFYQQNHILFHIATLCS